VIYIYVVENGRTVAKRRVNSDVLLVIGLSDSRGTTNPSSSPCIKGEAVFIAKTNVCILTSSLLDMM
jgi:hypothetical protein